MRSMPGPFVLLSAVVLATTSGSAQTPPGDHYFCYKAAIAPGQPKFVAAQKTLQVER